MAIVPSTMSWADFVDEEHIVDVSEEKKVFHSNDAQISSAQIGAVDDDLFEVGVCGGDREETLPLPGNTPSVGSLGHKTGRCKPCAFFHTRGCENGMSCVFCHLCPPGEKQRRKRLQEHLRGKLDERFQTSPTFNPQVARSFKSGHARQNSGNSTATTQSTWSKSSHSRQSSGSSMASFAQEVDAAPTVAPKMPGRMISLSQSVPEHNNVTEHSITGPGQWTTATPDQWTAAMPGQWMTPWPSSGMVQYTLVAVAVPQQPAMDPSMPYAYFPQEPLSQSQVQSEIRAWSNPWPRQMNTEF